MMAMVSADQSEADRCPGVATTQLAEERTYLAWFRSALAAFAVALAVGKVVPALTGAARVPYLVLGVGFGVQGLVLAVYGRRRQRDVTRAAAAGTYAEMDPRMLRVLTASAALLGTLLLVLLLCF
jgi:putative membrane protein